MRYDKQPIEFDTQISLLKERGMIFKDEDEAINCLYSISYFRLASYWKSRELKKSSKFKKNTVFDDILKLYRFDMQLHNVVFAALQAIEIAFRTRMSHFLSMKYGAFWFLNTTLFKNVKIHRGCVEKLKEELSRSHEDFLTEHLEKYDEPDYPPSWKTMEVASFGTLSKLYSNLADNNIKKEIAKSFQLPSYLFLENWMKCAVVLRNCCAHHSRLWNRRFSLIPKYPAKLPYPWIATRILRPEKLYGQLCCLVYLEHTIKPNSNLKANIIKLISENPEIDLKAMGIQPDWEKQPLWK